MTGLVVKITGIYNDFSIYTKSKKEARKVGNGIYLFLKDKLRLPINREKSGVRRPSDFELLGHAFVPTYQKGVKGGPSVKKMSLRTFFSEEPGRGRDWW